ncbi:hypothetical protein JW711_06065 [Candidatus Woesearchaeota archaeon]|nr:hypothetical protein [Candidatus Woesearchaeota archaeon]
MADDFRGFFYAMAGFGFGAYLFYKGFAWFQQKRMIENTPTSKVRSIAMGRVEVYGEARVDKKFLVIAPFSGKKCVYCKWTVEEYRSNGKSGHWATIRTGCIGRLFFLKDDTGEVLVDSAGAEVDIPRCYDSKKVTDSAKNFLQEQGLPYTSIFGFGKNMRFREYIIFEKTKVYVMGFAGDNPYVEDGTSDRNEKDIMIQKEKGGFYYISDKPEKEILKKYFWKTWGGLFGGSAIMLLCLAIMFAYLGIL